MLLLILLLASTSAAIAISVGAFEVEQGVWPAAPNLTVK